MKEDTLFPESDPIMINVINQRIESRAKIIIG